MENELVQLAIPTLTIAGGRDDTVSAAEVVALCTSLPEPKKLVIVEEAGHDYPPELINPEVTTWLRDAMSQAA